ncbi:hypothetical protein [Vibrio nigripulchritudo]|uniref:hypothetical protein n=1 Tax=Vibrio nigripulchritudo TaxID=28173 RepID=UPI0003B22A2E|nr:hypothetical protein [Vibrio nigripulchritudo]CCN69778.1 hypothetical protein VIBNISFn118_150032 [Vibrio nigripulchritudo SFn118]
MKNNEQSCIKGSESTLRLRSFFRTKKYRYTLGFGIVCVCTLSGFIIYDVSQTHEFNWTKEAIKYFFTDMMEVPFKVATGFVAIITLLALEHRSQQTNKQMKLTIQQIALTNQQNIFTNYYKHLEEFTAHVEDFLSNSSYFPEKNRRQVRFLHGQLFPGAKEGQLDTFCTKYFTHVEVMSADLSQELQSSNLNDLLYDRIYDVSSLLVELEGCDTPLDINIHGSSPTGKVDDFSFLKECLGLLIHSMSFAVSNLNPTPFCTQELWDRLHELVEYGPDSGSTKNDENVLDDFDEPST